MTLKVLNSESTIYKYSLNTADAQTVYIPTGYKILCVQLQDGQPTLWVQVEPNNDKEPVTIEIKGTGHLMNTVDSRNYIGTYQLHNGALVFHVFEIKE